LISLPAVAILNKLLNTAAKEESSLGDGNSGSAPFKTGQT
jgi:hypothetical protein